MISKYLSKFRKPFWSNSILILAILAMQSVRRRSMCLATFIGLVPMITETSTQAQFLIPMALSIAFGSLFAGAVILILVPVCLLIIVKEPAT
ncbi:MAG: hypothetical protein ABJG15_16125 [Hyphomonadaceae bacterium]